jgi:polyisoprenoid-binding protein YceI
MQNKEVSRLFLAMAVLAVAFGPFNQARGQARLAPGDINLEASRVYIFVDKTGFGHQHAIEGRLLEGAARMSGRSSGSMVFDLRSFRADTPVARQYVSLKGEMDKKTREDVTANMLAPEVLDVARFPTATFAIDSLRPVEVRGKPGMIQYRFDGEFRLHGVKRPLRFMAEGGDERGYLHLKGNFRLRQTDFKITPFKKALGAVGVADVLTVYGDIWIKR